MSFKMINWAYGHELPAATLLTLVTLADMANDQGRTEVSREYLIWKTGQSQRTIARHYAELRDRNLLHQEERRRRDGLRGVSETVLHWHVQGTRGDWPGREQWLEEAKERRRKYEIVDSEALEASGANVAHEGETPGQNNMPTWHMTSLPVDNVVAFEGSGATGGSRHVPNPTGEQGGALIGTRARFNPSSSSVPAGPTRDDDDDRNFHRRADLRLLAQAAGGRFAKQPRQFWVAVVDIVLERARGRVSAPTKFVATAVEADPWGLMAAAVERAGLHSERSLASSERMESAFGAGAAEETGDSAWPLASTTNGSSRSTWLGSGDRPCPVEGHSSYAAHNCPACAVADRVLEPEDVPVADLAAADELRRRLQERRRQAK